MNTRFHHYLTGALSAALLHGSGSAPVASAAEPASRPLRTLILSRVANPTTPDLKHILSDTGRFEVSVCEAPDGLSASTFSPFDLVVIDTALAPRSDTAKAVAAFAFEGKGVLVSRGGRDLATTSSDWPLTGTTQSEQPVRFLDVKIARSEHPIVKGLADSFRTADSVHAGLNASAGARVLATIDSGDRKVPVLATSSLGKGRAVSLGLGADSSAMHESAFRVLLARAGEWAASGEVTLPASLGTHGSSANAVKALLITGGHDHDAAFYSLFNGLDSLPVDTAANAFKKDVRGKYDVIIMYDFTRDLDEVGRKNLRDFVESGKGVVVLHHALLNFQTWTWWSEDVVGGRYRLRRENGKPSSSVKDDRQIDVSPATAHPVVNGIGPFHITDEAYKNLYMSSKNKPLLTTDNPTSDTNLAWIGPCETSRVVAIQLGHGRSAFGHAAYRALVHNAVLWAAGKTKSPQ